VSAENTFRKVYKFLKLVVDENLIIVYDEAYLCSAFSWYLSTCAEKKVKDTKLNKFVRLVVIFLLKLK